MTVYCFVTYHITSKKGARGVFQSVHTISVICLHLVICIYDYILLYHGLKLEPTLCVHYLFTFFPKIPSMHCCNAS